MKRSALIIVVAGLLAGIVAHACVYLVRTMPERKVAGSRSPALAWMREEFGLTESQFRELTELHDGYLPRCEEMCRRISLKGAELDRLLKEKRAVTPEVRAVLGEMAGLRAECQANMLEHFHNVARTMAPQQGERYLEWIKGECFGDQIRSAAGPQEAPHQHRMQ